MAEPKPLTYDERKAAEAAFTGAPLNPAWTESARELYARISAVARPVVHDTEKRAVEPEFAGLNSGRP